MKIDIDQVVGRIISDLSQEPELSPRITSVPKDIDRSTLIFDQKLVTLSDIAKKTQNAKKIKTVLLPPKAIVTPSVKDFFRKQGITVRFDELPQNFENGTNGNSVSIRLVLHALKNEPKMLLEQWKREYRLEILRKNCIFETLEFLGTGLLSSEGTGIVLSNHGTIALCLANRRPDIRAFSSDDPTKTASDAESIGANLLIVEPERTGPFKLGRIVKTFLDGSPRDCPKLLQSKIPGKEQA